MKRHGKKFTAYRHPKSKHLSIQRRTREIQN